MATGGLYGSSGTGALIAQPGSESSGLYGNSTSFGGTYFEWFIFQVSETQPATPTGGTWNFTTNANTPPAGWSSTPPANPSFTVWVSIAIVNSKNTAPLVWSVPGKFAYASGLPILSGNVTPDPGLGQTDQLYIQLNTTPQTIWFKEAGTWTRITGSTLYADLTSNQTIAGTKTFSSQIQGSISGTASNVTGTVAITNGGTGSTTAASARVALGALNNITSTDGSVTITSPSADVRNLSVAVAAATNNVIAQVRNATGATLTKGTVVYITGATGQISTVNKAIANTDSTSAQTLGMITADLPNNTNGNVTIIGLISNIDTSAYTDGAQLYLSPTVAGGVTTTKPYAPNHLVYVGIVEYAHPVNGKIFVKVQNGYELDELHNVAAQSPTNGQTIVYNSSTNLWEKNTVSLAIGVNGTLPILNGGTGQTTANAAFNALAPSQTGNSGRYLTTDGSNTSWAVNPLGTVTSVSGTGTVSGISLSGTVTTSGSLTLGGTLDLSSPPTIGNTTPNTGAFTTLTTSSTVTLNAGTANGVAYLNGSKVLTTGSALTFDGTNFRAVSNTRIEGTGIGITGTGDGAEIFSNSGITYLQAFNRTTPAFIPLVFSAGTYIAHSLSGSEQMRLTSTGLGIGTSSPASKLHVNAASGSVFAQISSGANDLYLGYDSVSGMQTMQSDTGIYFSTGASFTERMRLNSSGNLGIGTSSPAARLDVTRSSSITGLAGVVANPQLAITNNADWGYPTGAVFRSPLTSGGAVTNSGAVWSEWMAAPAASSAYLAFATTNSGTLTEAMRLNASGQLETGIAGSASAPSFTRTGDLNTGIFFPAADTIAFSEGGVESMRIDASGNLGIGTSSNRLSNKLDVFGNITIGNNASYFGQIGYNAGFGALDLTSGDGGFRFIRQSGSVTSMALDYSGNLGLGVTPSAWVAGYKALQVNNSSWYTDNNGNIQFAANTFQGSGFVDRYMVNGFAAKYEQINSTHRWFTAPSGTAGNAITFTQAMTLDASGNLGIGTSSPTNKLHIRGGNGNQAIFDNAGEQYTQITFLNNGTSKGALWVNNSASLFELYGSAGMGMTFSTNGSERARINTAGSFCVGGTGGSDAARIYADQATDPASVSYKGIVARSADAKKFLAALGLNSTGDLTLGQSYEGAGGSFQALTFYTSNAERARITSGGDFLIGGTTANGRLDVAVPDGATNALILERTGASPASLAVTFANQFSNLISSGVMTFAVNGSERARIDSSGNLLVGTTSQLRTGDKLSVLGIGTQVATFNQDTNTSGYSAISTIIGSNGNNTSTYHFWGNTSGVGNWYLYGNGTTSYSSDARLKKNIVTTRDGYLDDVLKLRVVKYNWLKDDDSTPKELGLIAQEVEKVFPGLVQDDLNPVEDGGEIYKQVKQSVLPFMLLKAIQELKAEFDAYKASHP